MLKLILIISHVVLLAASANVLQHAANCRRVLGPIPGFNCLDGKKIITTYNGEPITKLVLSLSCDRPGGAGGYADCLPGARIGRISSGAVDWVFLCRRSQFVTGDTGPWGAIGYIGSNRETGETCFFDSDRTQTGEVPSPENDNSNFWTSERGDACLHCHTNNQPWLRTPYLAGTKVLPLVPLLKRITPGWGYRVIDVTPVRIPVAIFPRAYDGREDRTCTSCHTITRGFYGDSLVPYLTGAVQLETGGQLSPWAKDFPQSHTMPFGHNAGSREEWEITYGEAMKRLRHCLSENDPVHCLPPREVLAH